MRFSQLQQLITTQWAEGNPRDIFFIQSSPGIGKSALAHLISKQGNFDHVAEINASLLDTPDLAGLALLNGNSDVLQFKKSPLLAPLQEGRNLVIWEEVPDSNIAMQNLVARWAYDREVNGMHLSDQTYHLMLGNRSKDKSGAGRVSTKLSNRVCVLEMDASLDDWVDNFALPGNVNPVGIQFLRFKPNLFSTFDPDAPLGINPTPRAWTRAFATSDKLPTDLYFAKVKGEVGEGPAAEYTAFRKIYQELVSFEDVIMNPKGVPIPKDLSAQYALVGSLAHNVTPGNVERVAEFVERMRSDFGVMFWNDSIKKTPKLKTTKPFMAWATSANNVIM